MTDHQGDVVRDADRPRSTASQRAGFRTAQRRNEVRAEEARIQSERQNLGRARTRAESWALIAAALVGAASLSVTAWGTYWTAQVAEDQLAQSREQDDDKAKDQASKVAYWLESHKSDPRKDYPDVNRLVIANRSLDPVGEVGLVTAVTEVSGERPTEKVSAFGGTVLGTIPPCSVIRVEATSLHRNSGKPVSKSDVRIIVLDMSYADARGKTWRRGRGGNLEARSGPFSLDKGYFPLLKDLGAYPGEDVQSSSAQQLAIANAAPKPLDGCGSKD